MMFKALSDAQLAEITKATETILEKTGVKVMNDDALARCRGAGARVDEASGRVRLPRHLLHELIAQVPHAYTVKGADGIERRIGDGQQWGQAIVTDPWIIDYATRRPRRPRLEDVRRNTIVAQQMENIIGMSLMDFPVEDVEGPHSNLHALREHLLHHSKHIYVYATSIESLEWWLAIGRILLGGEDLHGSRLFSVAVASLSPLAVSGFNADMLRIACGHGFPVVPTVCPTAGMTSPFSLAGTLVQGNAEALFILALTQIYRPGNPFLYCLGPAVGNMRSGANLYYTLDKVLWKAAHVELAKFYGLPVAAECGGTMTGHFDPQSGAEGMLFMLAAVVPGADILCGFGSTLNAIGHSTEMMLIQHEYFRAAQFLREGIPTTDKHLALEAIDQAGPGGNFMTDDLTLDYLRGGEFFQSDLFDCSGELPPVSSLLERAHERVAAITASFKPPLPDATGKEISRFIEQEIHGKHLNSKAARVPTPSRLASTSR